MKLTLLAFLFGILAITNNARARSLEATIDFQLEIYDHLGYALSGRNLNITFASTKVEFGQFAGFVQGFCYQLERHKQLEQLQTVTVTNRFGGQGYRFSSFRNCPEIVKTWDDFARRNRLVSSYSFMCNLNTC